MNKIITHVNPDLDAIFSVWLVKRFLPGWEKAKVCFVRAGQTLDNLAADSVPGVLHVDVGMGELDHHQFIGLTSATQLTWDYILIKRKGQPLSPLETEALNRLVPVVTEVDNGRTVAWPEITLDRSQLYLDNLIYGLKKVITDDEVVVKEGLMILDSLLKAFKDKIRAEEMIENESIIFQSPWGKAIACKTGNEMILWEAEYRGYALVLKYDSTYRNRVKIYARFDSKVDLTKVYRQLSKIDSQADWFLHASKKLLLISSRPEARGTSLSFEEIVALLKK
ncbi:MAG TPA: chromate resistance protein ChrB domain-containing protein [Candidatus Bathyarchaeia archaeon]|nr:chromate resistance protein ChrB domain-containing protein [Candidatus Bathyarchaeia archaeon]